MAYKNREVQPEFFSELGKRKNKQPAKKKFFSLKGNACICVTYDTLVVIAISFLMINLLSFVLGIEKGKALGTAGSKINDMMLAENKADAIKGNINIASNKLKKNEQLKETDKSNKPNDDIEKDTASNNEQIVENLAKGYSIRLVTYSNNRYAQKEVKQLNHKGLNGFYLKDGKHYVVYSGFYNNKECAKEKLIFFRKQYKDCFISYIRRS